MSPTTTHPVLTRSRLEAILRAARGLRVGIVGDAALDVYWEADMTQSRLARENPHFILPVVRERLSPGGGSNAAACVAALGVASAPMLGFVGDDWRGRELRRCYREAGISDDYLLTTAERVTVAYCKPMRRGLIPDVVYEDPHLYFENRTPHSAALEAALLARLEALLAQVDAVLVADYQEFGAVTAPLRECLNAAGKAGLPILVDSRVHVNEYRHVVVKPNENEAVWSLDPARNPLQVTREELETIARDLAARGKGQVCVTLGGGGCLWATGESVAHIPTLSAPPPIDTVGAGDAFAAACVTALAAGASGPEAAAFGHLAAGVTVRKLGTTGTATPDEILQRFDEDYHG